MDLADTRAYISKRITPSHFVLLVLILFIWSVVAIKKLLYMEASALDHENKGIEELNLVGVI